MKKRVGVLVLAISGLLLWGTLSPVEAVINITIDPSSSTVGLSEIFEVDLVLNLDTTVSDIDGLGIYLKYDPSILNVLDYDIGNWVSAGTNILDGPYHTPFDLPGSVFFPNRNVVGPAGGIPDGEISWYISDGFFEPAVSVPAGSNVFATIKFQAAGIPGATALTFYGANSGGVDDTWVHSRLGGYLLAYDKSFVGGDVTVVIPEPGTVFLLGLGSLALLRKRRL